MSGATHSALLAVCVQGCSAEALSLSEHLALGFMMCKAIYVFDPWVEVYRKCEVVESRA